VDRAKRRHRLRGILARADRGNRHFVGDNGVSKWDEFNKVLNEATEAERRSNLEFQRDFAVMVIVGFVVAGVILWGIT